MAKFANAKLNYLITQSVIIHVKIIFRLASACRHAGSYYFRAILEQTGGNNDNTTNCAVGSSNNWGWGSDLSVIKQKR